ncbi:hypothetical protein ACIA8K_18270 [Catenuloplanes sp. NPDC051500]|uniref:hypothetical protein n=1 Tax=Catenuloplanes sp. NPDC051500 TaxID=3363959 RepID=UPI0037873724
MSTLDNARHGRAALRWFTRTAAVAGLVLAGALSLAGPAAANPAPDAAGTIRVAGPAPDAATIAAMAAVSPGMSPTPRRVRHQNPGDFWDCPSGNLCLDAWDPTTGNWKVFDLYNCNRYYFSNWEGTGYHLDNQTGGVTSYVYNQSGGVIASFTPGGGITGINWTPAWSIRNC